MAELVDALGSGPSGGNTVEVRVLFWAPDLRCQPRSALSHSSQRAIAKQALRHKMRRRRSYIGKQRERTSKPGRLLGFAVLPDDQVLEKARNPSAARTA